MRSSDALSGLCGRLTGETVRREYVLRTGHAPERTDEGCVPDFEIMTDSAPRVLLIGRPQCHLCDDARAVVSSVCDRLGVAWQEQSILDDPALYDEYEERIPVLLVDGEFAGQWLLDAEELSARLSG